MLKFALAALLVFANTFAFADVHSSPAEIHKFMNQFLENNSSVGTTAQEIEKAIKESEELLKNPGIDQKTKDQVKSTMPLIEILLEVKKSGGRLSKREALKIFPMLHEAACDQAKIRKDPDLTELELLSICLYSGGEYSNIHSMVKTNPNKISVLIHSLDSALSKLPVYQGKVIRTSYIAPADLSALTPGKILNHKSYTSSSKKQVGVAKYNVVINFQNKSGRDITNYSVLPEEEEILLPRNARLKIISIKETVQTTAPATHTIEAVEL